MKNKYFRGVLFAGKYCQLSVMSLLPGEEIGNEVHRRFDPVFRIEEGEDKLVLNGKA